MTPALQCFLLDSITAWASHPDVRDAVDELAGSGHRELLEPSISQALATVTAARPGALRHRPSEGRRARVQSSAHEGGGDAASSDTRTVFSGTAQRWGSSIVLLGLVGLALASLIVCVLIAADWSANRGSGLPVAWSGGIALGLGLVAAVGARIARVRYRIVTTDAGARLEIDDGPRSTSMPFPLDYRASMEHVRIRIRGIPRHYFRLHLVVTGEGHAPIAFVEEREEPARGWADDPDHPLAYDAYKVYRCREIESLEQELARWNQKGRDVSPHDPSDHSRPVLWMK